MIPGRGICAGQLLSSAMGDRQCEGSRLPPGQAQAEGLNQQSWMSLDGQGDGKLW